MFHKRSPSSPSKPSKREERKLKLGELIRVGIGMLELWEKWAFCLMTCKLVNIRIFGEKHTPFLLLASGAECLVWEKVIR